MTADDTRATWLGPHFYFDLIRIARKGWPTLLRVVYLSILLIGLTLMFQAKGNTVGYQSTSQLAQETANRAHAYAYVLIVLQYVLILLLMPVYLASTIVEEKETRTLESLFLSHMTERELVMGKFGARLLHLGLIVLASFPLLAFMHLWGNVDLGMLLFHEINTLLILVTGASVCILVSAKSESVFQAITRSYPWLFLLGFLALLGAFGLPYVIGVIAARVHAGLGEPEPWYFSTLAVLLPFYAGFTVQMLHYAVQHMKRTRVEERKLPRKATSSFSLSDRPKPPPARGRKRRQTQSHIHPLALPIPDGALFWKESMKDGSSWSLTFKWLWVGLLIVVGAGVLLRLMGLAFSGVQGTDFFRSNSLAYSFAYTSYFVSLSAYALVVLFQTTMCVAGEREQDTLVFLLMIPEKRGTILFHKWLGPIWRNWPILAICYLGVLLGLGAGLYSPLTALILIVLPWPFLLMLNFFALWLSVVGRRVLFANIGLVGFLILLFIAHVVLGRYIGIVFPYYASLMFETNLMGLTNTSLEDAFRIALLHQGSFLAIAVLCGLLAFWRFQRKDYAPAS